MESDSITSRLHHPGHHQDSQQPLKGAPRGLSLRGGVLGERSGNVPQRSAATGQQNQLGKPNMGQAIVKKKAQGFTIYQDHENQHAHPPPASHLPTFQPSTSTSTFAINTHHNNSRATSSMHHSQSAPAFKVFCDPPQHQSEEEDDNKENEKFWAEPIAKLQFVHQTRAATAASSSSSSIGLSFKDVRNHTHLLPQPRDVFPDLSSEGNLDSPMVLDASVCAANVSMESTAEEDADENIQIGDSSNVLEDTEDDASEQRRPEDEATRRMLASEEYVNDIYSYLKELEIKFAPKWSYMQKQPDISYPMRAILVDWLIEVGEEYKLQPETIHLAVNYIDRFLSIMSVQRAKLQLVGTACMFIAAKYEEIYPPDVAEFVYITDDTYSKKQVLRMEQLVLSALKFDLAAPTTLLFSNMYCRAANDDDRTTTLAQYITELTLLEAETFLKYGPSEVAAAVTVVARHCRGKRDVWPAACASLAELSLCDFRECVELVHEFHAKMEEHPQQAMREKYKSERFSQVSQIASNPLPSTFFWVEPDSPSLASTTKQPHLSMKAKSLMHSALFAKKTKSASCKRRRIRI